MTFDTSSISIIGVIPAHLASVRYPGKILVDIHGIPMIEHVRRRALLCSGLSRVLVATCDKEIAGAVHSYGGDVILTSNVHRNGTSRVAEATASIECSHIVLLQGDEPLLLPRHVDELVNSIHSHPEAPAWNATASITSPDQLDRASFVKCSISPSGKIMYCYRRSPSFSSFSDQLSYTRKILGLIAFKKSFLQEIVSLPPSLVEQAESIEQMRIIESGYNLLSVPVAPSLPSVNEPHEMLPILSVLENDEEQKYLLSKILS